MPGQELKPCPFCGRKPSKVREHRVPSISDTFYSVECKAPLSKCAAIHFDRPGILWWYLLLAGMGFTCKTKKENNDV